MTRASRVLASAVAVAAAALMLSGCAALRELVAEVPVDVPQPSLPASAEPFTKIYQGGDASKNTGQEDWATKAERRIVAAAALKGIFVYSVENEPGTDGLTVRIKGDPEDTALIANVEDNLVPVAQNWAPSVTIIIDPSLCGIVGEVRDESPVCDALAGR
ncbi:hypothetical protein [Demequina sp.]|uniref:hypothetical protein n=1 Tax=Demequina sp. TaxID=2050685 RepID=UPI003D0E4593